MLAAAATCGNFTQIAECAPALRVVAGCCRTSYHPPKKPNCRHCEVFSLLRVASYELSLLRNSGRSVFRRTPRLNVVSCQEGKVKVRFLLDHQVGFGEHHALLGSTASAGEWERSVLMSWTEAGWVANLETEPGETMEYKFLLITGDGSAVWESGANRVMVMPSESGYHYEVVSHWDETEEETHFEVTSPTLALDDEVRVEDREELDTILEGHSEEYETGSVSTAPDREELDTILEGHREEHETSPVSTAPGKEELDTILDGRTEEQESGSGFTAPDKEAEGTSYLKSNETMGTLHKAVGDEPGAQTVESSHSPPNWWTSLLIVTLPIITLGIIASSLKKN